MEEHGSIRNPREIFLDWVVLPFQQSSLVIPKCRCSGQEGNEATGARERGSNRPCRNKGSSVTGSYRGPRGGNWRTGQCAGGV